MLAEATGGNFDSIEQLFSLLKNGAKKEKKKPDAS